MDKLQISFRVLDAADAPALSALLQAQPVAYLESFHPFSFAEKALRGRLENIRRDLWWGIEWAGELAGLVVLRGFDEGYERPAFGVFVAERFTGRGLGKAAVIYAQDWARGNDIRAIMLKVAPKNHIARDLYERHGFRKISVCPESGQDIYEWTSHDVAGDC